MLDLVENARRIGFNARGVAFDDTHEIPMPVIVHYKGGHYVFAKRMDHHQVTVVDNGQEQTLDESVFMEKLSGYAVIFKERIIS